MIGVETKPAPARRGKRTPAAIPEVQAEQIGEADPEVSPELAAPGIAPITSRSQRRRGSDLNAGPDYATTAAQSGEQIQPYPNPGMRNASFETACNYWNTKLTPEQRKAGCVYVYRDWPVILPERVTDKAGKVHLQNTNSLKILAEDGPISAELIFSKLKIGDYTLRINQYVVKPNGTVMFSQLRTPRDWKDENMPILDIDRLDLADPYNEEYIKILRAKGILQRVADEAATERTAKENAMEAVQTQVMGNALNKLVDTVIEMGSARGAAAANMTDGESRVAEKLVDIVERQMDRDTPPEKQGTVKETIEGLVQIATSMKPEPVDTKPFLQTIEANNKQIAAMQERELLRAQEDTRRFQQELLELKRATPPPKTFTDQLKELEELESFRNRVRGDTPAAATPAAGESNGGSSFLGVLPKVLDTTKVIFASAANMYFNYLAAQKGEAPINPATEQPSTELAAPDMSDAVDPEVKQRMELTQQYFTTLSRIAPFLVNYLNKGRSGTDFAKLIINMSDELTFQGLVECGQAFNRPSKEILFELVQQHPQIWEVVNPIPERFDRFLTEFLAYRPQSQTVTQ